jgi:hypothetical protein
VHFLNESRINRAQPRLGDPTLIGGEWALRTVDEVLAFLFSETGVSALHRAGRSPQARVSLGLTPEEFVTSYARHLWLREVQDRSALATPGGHQALLHVSANPAFRALFVEVERWLNASPLSAQTPGTHRR